MAAVYNLDSDEEYEILDFPRDNREDGACSSFDIDNPHTRPRTVQLTKVDGQIGIRRCGSQVEEVIAGSAADLQGGIYAGDKLISIDGTNVERLSSEQISRLLEGPSPKVTLVVKFDARRAELLKQRKEENGSCSLM
ncbi:hypothetical protein PENTCL1PPCAC_21741 [Pristionchus entomophagus]|uniref:PDZ domain-containing protein n=1 Tax=Pristionchus entomophagus TaxID=358040 RepID=A0AAV5TZ85_9BILA|nr:hypothetical protein PENTCL1PPCAC_21741 [Pristionchus entomophagus]